MACARCAVRSAGSRFSLLSLALMPLLGSPVIAQPADVRADIDVAVRTFMDRTAVPGVAIGFVTPAGGYVLSYGVASKETGVPVDERTLFEIGSISKTFTATLAAYAAETGALKWADPASSHVPQLKGSHLDRVSLLNLATHTTGGMPLQLPDKVKTNADLIAFFRSWSPPSAPGAVRSYANPSIGLLGVAAAHALKGDFAALMRDRVFAPIGLTSTFYQVPEAEQNRLAQGYTRNSQPARVASRPLSAEAYGVRTTAKDLLRWVEAQLDLAETPPELRRALSATHIGYFRAGPMTQALVWEWYAYPVSASDFATGHSDVTVLEPNPVTRLEPPQAAPAEAVVDKTGATSGFGAYAAFIPGRRTGLVVLANRNHPTAARLALAERIFAALGVGGVGGRP